MCSSVAAQVYVRDNYLMFTSIGAYESYANNETDRSILYYYTYGDSSVTSRAEVQEGENDEEQYPDFLNLILNQDNIVGISSFLVKVDLINGRALAINVNEPNAYWSLVNEDWSAPLIYLSEEDDGIEVLENIENGGWYPAARSSEPRIGTTASVSSRTASSARPIGRIESNGCSGAPRYKCDEYAIWDSIPNPNPEPGHLYDLYRMDYKVVYQKAIIYFSLQSKQKSRTAYESSNWIFVPTYDAAMKLDGRVRYRKRCGGEVVKNEVLYTVDREQNWRPYEGSRSLSHYDFSVTFGIDHPQNNPRTWHDYTCSIMSGYSAGHAGMTWRSIEQRAGGVVHVGSDSQTNPYHGDTAPSASLPILCLRVDNVPAPAGITPDFYNGWAKGSVALSSPVTGSALTSRTAADSRCSSQFGPTWRMAEFHDGYYGPNLAYSGGWSYWAYGNIPVGTRFWVAINDQPANPWN
ncbi:MAG TPA: hypothetical protein VF432_01400 [Thermoanaerobaculia bacterium]